MVSLDLPLRAAGPSRAGAVRCAAELQLGLGWANKLGLDLAWDSSGALRKISDFRQPPMSRSSRQ